MTEETAEEYINKVCRGDSYKYLPISRENALKAVELAREEEREKWQSNLAKFNKTLDLTMKLIKAHQNEPRKPSPELLERLKKLDALIELNKGVMKNE